MTEGSTKKNYSRQALLSELFDEDKSISGILKSLSKRPWRPGPYAKQSWGNWLHRMAPYAGRMKPAFAHWLIRICSSPNDLVLDPFCGIGTVPLEANLMGRQSIGFDLNPYGYTVARAKMDRRPMKEHIERLETIELKCDEVNLDEIPEWVKFFFNIETMKEILALKSILEKEKNYFILGCLLGIAQGHRIGHLSKHSALTLPFKPRPDDPGEYRAVIPRMIAKVKRTYKDGIPFEPCGKIELADARNMPLEDNSVDIIISSPPYFDTVDYVSSNRLRLALMGYHDRKAEEVRKVLIQNHKNYLMEIGKACSEMKRVLKPGGKCILVLGDSYKRRLPINTAEKVGGILGKIGMKVHGTVEDTIPFSKSVQRTPRSKQIRQTQRFDRVMVITNEK